MEEKEKTGEKKRERSKRKDDENCISNAEQVMKFSQGHWTFLGPGSEEKWYGSSSCDQKKENGIRWPANGTAIQGNLTPCVQRYQCPESWDPEDKEG